MYGPYSNMHPTYGEDYDDTDEPPKEAPFDFLSYNGIQRTPETCSAGPAQKVDFEVYNGFRRSS